MTMERDSEYSDFFNRGLDDNSHTEEPAADDKISVWLAGSVIFFLVLMFMIAGLIVQRVYFQPPVVRTAVERELLRYKTEIRNHPKNAEAYVGLARIYLQIDQTDKAIKELNTALQLEPRSWNVHFELGSAYEAQRKTDKALVQYWKAASIDQNNEFSYYQIGRIYHKQKLYGQAIQAYIKALHVNPTLSDVHYYLGLCYEKTNKRELAKKEYQEAIRYVEDYPEAEAALKRLQ